MRQTKKAIEEELLVSEKHYIKYEYLKTRFIDFTNRIQASFKFYFIDGNKKERGNEEKTKNASNGIDGKMLH